MTKPITVWVTPPGPNSWKVVVVLVELRVPFEIKSFSYGDVKKRPFTDVNPNGRVPAIEDPNTGITVWESGAILQYLDEVYDKERKLNYTSLEQRHHVNQWLHFQMSGQGPYYGQCGWFKVLHSENVASAVERYTNEVRRVLGVLDGVLDGREWLVGDRMTFADLAFLPWNDRLDTLLPETKENVLAPWPNVAAWQARMAGRESWRKSMVARGRLMDEQGLDWRGMPKEIETLKEYDESLAKAGEGEGCVKIWVHAFEDLVKDGE